MRKAALLAAGACALCACRGAVPARNAPPEQAISAILIGGRMLLPSGPARRGLLHLNFESAGGGRAEIYRLPISGGENSLYLVEPGVYRLAPTRSLFGSYEEKLTVEIEGARYFLAFPRELLRQSAYEIKPGKLVAIGVIEAKVMPAPPGQTPPVRVAVDDSLETRRKLIQDAIRDMMDPARPPEARESAVVWSRALQNSLMTILSEDEKRPLFKPAP